MSKQSVNYRRCVVCKRSRVDGCPGCKLGAPPTPALLTRDVNGAILRIFQWQGDKSYRLTLDTCFKQEGDTKYWKHREVNGWDLLSLLVELIPSIDQSTIKEITEQCSN